MKHNRLANLVEDNWRRHRAINPAELSAISARLSVSFRLSRWFLRALIQAAISFRYHRAITQPGGIPCDAWILAWQLRSSIEEQFRKLRTGARAPLLRRNRCRLAVIKNNAGLVGGLGLSSRKAQIRFIRLRDTLPALAGPERAIALREIRKILREEIQLARRLHDLAARDSTIGFEATNQYAYSIQDLIEKVLNCKYLLAKM